MVTNGSNLIFKLDYFDRVAGDEIINPIQSARMVTSNSFSFTYGTIEVRAKMPKGDWIWPGTFDHNKLITIETENLKKNMV